MLLPSRSLLRLATWCAYASGAVAAPGVLALIGMYAVLFAYGEQHPAFSPFGIASDIAVLLQYAIALPLPVALHQLLGDRAPRLSLAGMLIAIGAMTAIVVLQVLLLAGVLPFEEQVGPISSMFVVLVMWFVVTGFLGRSGGRLPERTLRMSLLGASYFGYPIWAFWMGGHRRRWSDGPLSSQDAHRTGQRMPEALTSQRHRAR
jgi:hypothetical protein